MNNAKGYLKEKIIDNKPEEEKEENILKPNYVDENNYKLDKTIKNDVFSLYYFLIIHFLNCNFFQLN